MITPKGLTSFLSFSDSFDKMSSAVVTVLMAKTKVYKLENVTPSLTTLDEYATFVLREFHASSKRWDSKSDN